MCTGEGSDLGRNRETDIVVESRLRRNRKSRVETTVRTLTCVVSLTYTDPFDEDERHRERDGVFSLGSGD